MCVCVLCVCCVLCVWMCVWLCDCVHVCVGWGGFTPQLFVRRLERGTRRDGVCHWTVPLPRSGDVHRGTPFSTWAFSWAAGRGGDVCGSRLRVCSRCVKRSWSRRSRCCPQVCCHDGCPCRVVSIANNASGIFWFVGMGRLFLTRVSAVFVKLLEEEGRAIRLPGCVCLSGRAKPMPDRASPAPVVFAFAFAVPCLAAGRAPSA